MAELGLRERVLGRIAVGRTAMLLEQAGTMGEPVADRRGGDKAGVVVDELLDGGETRGIAGKAFGADEAAFEMVLLRRR